MIQLSRHALMVCYADGRMEPLGIEEIMHVIDEASQVIAYSRRLEQQSRDLEAVSGDLRAANLRLRELDRLKDDFISTVTHE